MILSAAFVFLVPGAVALSQQPLGVDHAAHSATESASFPLKVAIVGGGAAGSSAAYFLNHFSGLNATLNTEVTLYEQSDYIGGRSTVFRPWNDAPFDNSVVDKKGDELPMELGGSIFVQANKNLLHAVEKFNLTLSKLPGTPMAVWDGESLVFEQGSNSWWNGFKLLWRYGKAPLRTKSIVERAVNTFLSLYSSKFVGHGPFNSVEELAKRINFTYPLSKISRDYFIENDVNPAFIDEIITIATTVNYGTPASKIHGIGGFVSLSTSGATAVEGGNRKIFENFARHSGAKINLNTQVTAVQKLDDSSKWVLRTADGTNSGVFDAVIVACPWYQTGIQFVNTPASDSVAPQAYVKLHTTFVITNASSPSPVYFNRPADSPVSAHIYSSFDTASETKPKFNSLSNLKTLKPETSAKFNKNGIESTWYVYKLFSSAELPASELDAIFGGAQNIAKTVEKIWYAYPQLDPVTTSEELSPFRPDTGIYYVNAFERLVSTMETETVASFNTITLLLRDVFGYAANSSWVGDA